MKNKLPKNAKKVFKGVIFDVYHWEQELFDGSKATFERLLRPDTVVIIGTVGDKIIIQKQKQPDRDHWFKSLPGGRVEEGEEPLKAAKRELLEETGYASDDWQPWKEFKLSNKIIWTIHVFIAKNCYEKKEQNLDAGEQIENQLMNFDYFIMLSEEDRKIFNESEMKMFLYRLRLYPQEKEKFRKLLFE